MKMVRFWLVTMLLFGYCWGEEFINVDEAFKLQVQREESSLFVDFEITDGYYLYRDKYAITPFESFEVSEPNFSDNVVIKYDPNFDEDLAVFHNYMEVTHQVKSDTGYFQVTYQGCADAGLCYPPQKRYFTYDGQPIEKSNSTAPVSLDGLVDDTANVKSTFNDAGTNKLNVISALVFALIGGLILNLMPCVFPVLSLKAMSIAAHGNSTQHAKANGLAYTAGVVLSFVAVAALLLLARSFGDWIGWGFQLQSPMFVAFLVLLFFIMALVMSGYFEFGQSFMGVGQGLTTTPGLRGSFFTGVLATVVATPCTAPFMGAAIGFALTQPAYISLLVFCAMGLGLAAPILAISYLPFVAKFLPKPGAWMVVFRQVLAFPLFLTTLWLLWVLIEIRGSDALLKVGFGLILFAMAVWPALNPSSAASKLGRRLKFSVKYALIMFACVLVLDQRKTPELWQEYSPELVQRELSNQNAVFIDVTAAWCITCKANERVALSGNRFESLVAQTNVTLIKADWTVPNPAVDALIAGYERDGVPLYVYYPVGRAQEPIILPQLLSPSLIDRLFSTGSLTDDSI